MRLRLLVYAVCAAVFFLAGPDDCCISAWAASAQKTTAVSGNRVVKKATKKAQAKKITTTKKATSAKTRTVSKVTKKVARPSAKNKRKKTRRRIELPSVATLQGLRKSEDQLSLTSSVATLYDQNKKEFLFQKNADVQLPIASVTKLMTALVIAESGVSLQEKLKLTREDYVRDRAKSKLRNGMVMTRQTVLQAALMSSDNRAAHLLARTFPGGQKRFVEIMNETARRIGMTNSHFADPTGLNNNNVSTARDLALLGAEASKHKIIRQCSTTPVALLHTGRYYIRVETTNRLIGDPRWKVGLQKTGYTTAAGRCMVVQTTVSGHPVVMVVLDSVSSGKRANDMLTMKRWLEGEIQYEEAFQRMAPYMLL